jgi:hypothetical protein
LTTRPFGNSFAEHLVAPKQALAKEVREQLALPTFEDWWKLHAQRDLFEK